MMKDDKNFAMKLLRLIFSMTNNPERTHKIITILGLKLKIKLESKQSQQFYYKKIMNKLDKLYDIQKSNIEAGILHPQVFSKYKNKYQNQNIVLIGCGPSAKYYSQINNAIHIGVNRAYKLNNLSLQYLFVQDYMDEEDMIGADLYNPDTCEKFYGIIGDLRRKQVYPKIKKIPFEHVIKANANTYIIKTNFQQWDFCQDPSISPINDIGGTVFSALQFIIYTNPKRIFLVGCDCSIGHFHAEAKSGFGPDLTGVKIHWEKFKKYQQDYFNNIEIISINPVGLKGMFKEVYTQSYVNDHPELLNENIEILEK